MLPGTALGVQCFSVCRLCRCINKDSNCSNKHLQVSVAGHGKGASCSHCRPMWWMEKGSDWFHALIQESRLPPNGSSTIIQDFKVSYWILWLQPAYAWRKRAWRGFRGQASTWWISFLPHSLGQTHHMATINCKLGWESSLPACPGRSEVWALVSTSYLCHKSDLI